MAKNGVTRSFLATKYNVSTRTINEWAREIPDAKNKQTGLYDLAKFEEFTANRNSLDKTFQQLQSDKLRGEIAHLAIQTAQKEFDLKIKKGEYILLSEVLDDFKNALAICRSKLLALPHRHAMELSGVSEPKKIAATLTDSIDEALQAIADEMANYQQKSPPEDG